MTCQWDRTWTPTHILDECEWVACLRPPTPPKETNLRSTDWDGEPIEFGGETIFVCERGMFFEDDPEQENLIFKCQPDGFFDVPETDKQWPRCLRGKENYARI